MPCKAMCRKAKGEHEEQLVSCNEANDDPYRIVDQRDKMSSSELLDSIYEEF